MPTDTQITELYLEIARSHAKLSKAKRLKVGAVLRTKQNVLLAGYNGTVSGMNNVCEIIQEDGSTVTKLEVLHAEENCLMKAAREGVSVLDSTMYITHAPCLHCAAMLIQAGVKKVVYENLYRSTAGVELLREAKVEVCNLVVT